MVIASWIIPREGRIEQVKWLSADLQRQAIVAPQLVRHTLDGRKNTCFMVGMQPADQDAAHHDTIILRGVGCEPGCASGVSTQDESMASADSELGDIVIHVTGAVVVGGGLIWVIPPKARFDAPSIAWRLNSFPGPAMLTWDQKQRPTVAVHPGQRVVSGPSEHLLFS
jgi:hypothetical protein